MENQRPPGGGAIQRCLAGVSKLSCRPMKHQLEFEKALFELQRKLEELRKHPGHHSMDLSFDEEAKAIELKIEETRRQIYLNLNAWQRVQLARHPHRPY